MEVQELKQFIEEVLKQLEEGAKSQGYKIEGSVYFDEVPVWDREHNLHKIKFELTRG